MRSVSIVSTTHELFLLFFPPLNQPPIPPRFCVVWAHTIPWNSVWIAFFNPRMFYHLLDYRNVSSLFHHHLQLLFDDDEIAELHPKLPNPQHQPSSASQEFHVTVVRWIVDFSISTLSSWHPHQTNTHPLHPCHVLQRRKSELQPSLLPLKRSSCEVFHAQTCFAAEYKLFFFK